MNHLTKRLSDYLEKVTAQFAWDHDPNRKPRIFGPPDENDTPRPDLTKDEQRAHALGRLDTFEAAAAEKRSDLLEAELAAVRKINADAAWLYAREIRNRQDMDKQRSREETMAFVHRGLRRWEKQEKERKAERQERAEMQLGRRSWDADPAKVAEARSARQGGFKEHARRENTLQKARQYVATQKSKDPSPGIG